jgi:hypothetical protein
MASYREENPGKINVSKGCGDDIPPYLLGDESYSLINWSMTLFKEEEIHTII